MSIIFCNSNFHQRVIYGTFKLIPDQRLVPYSSSLIFFKNLFLAHGGGALTLLGLIPAYGLISLQGFYLIQQILLIKHQKYILSKIWFMVQIPYKGNHPSICICLYTLMFIRLFILRKTPLDGQQSNKNCIVGLLLFKINQM